MLARASATGSTLTVSVAVVVLVVAVGPSAADSRGGGTLKVLSTSLEASSSLEEDAGLLVILRSSSSSTSSSLVSLQLLLLPLADGEGGGGGLYSNRPSISLSSATPRRFGWAGLCSLYLASTLHHPPPIASQNTPQPTPSSSQ